MSGSQSRKQQTHLPQNTTSSPNKQQLKSVTTQVEYSGPLPLPEIMRGYEEILPGAAERILAMAEKEQSHRMENDDKIIDSEIESANRGMLFAFLLCASTLIVSVVIAILSKSGVGYAASAVVGASGFWSVARTMIHRKRDT